jgi:GMP synthase-like glutamine amidotransferase
MISLFQHGKDESPGEIGSYLSELQVPFTITRFFEKAALPEVLPSGLIVLGGQMSVNDTEDYPFLIEEKQVIRKMVAAGRPVLGICLGAQMIASAFGQRVFPDTRERGWVPVYPCVKSRGTFFSEPLTVFHWHNETFTLPADAILLQTGTCIKNQAFRLGSALGVQYHPEVTEEIISRWSTELRWEEREKILRESEKYSKMNRQNCRQLIDHFLRGRDFE